MKKIFRAPLPTQGLVLASLGSVLELEIGESVWRWPKGQCEMLWHQPSRSLVWFDCDEIPLEPAQVATKKAEAVYSRFKDREATRVRAAEYRVKGPWHSFGRASRVDYHSDKWGQKAAYTHALGRNVTFYRQGTDAGPWLFVLRGGTLRVTRRGLVG
jgi:hypothetical protein